VVEQKKGGSLWTGGEIWGGVGIVHIKRGISTGCQVNPSSESAAVLVNDLGQALGGFTAITGDGVGKRSRKRSHIGFGGKGLFESWKLR